MTTRKRRGMIIKNTNPRPVKIAMATREISLSPGEEAMVMPEEVRDARLREKLQVRAVAIVRPTSEEEEAVLSQTLSGDRDPVVEREDEHSEKGEEGTD